MSVDSAGTPWIVDNLSKISKFDGQSWIDMGLSNAGEIAAGPDGHVYALASD